MIEEVGKLDVSALLNIAYAAIKRGENYYILKRIDPEKHDFSYYKNLPKGFITGTHLILNYFYPVMVIMFHDTGMVQLARYEGDCLVGISDEEARFLFGVLDEITKEYRKNAGL